MITLNEMKELKEKTWKELGTRTPTMAEYIQAMNNR